MKSKWRDPLDVPSEYQSDAKTTIRVLVVAYRYDMARQTAAAQTTVLIGWYIGGLVQEWRTDGSPGNATICRWMPLPKFP